jgi:hypothetical protein
MSKSSSYQAVPLSDEVASSQEAAYHGRSTRNIYVASPPPPPRYVPQPGNESLLYCY